MHLFLDSNIYQGFFHRSEKELKTFEELVALIRKGKFVLWLPQQVKDEVARNRETHCLETMNKLSILMKISFPTSLKEQATSEDEKTIQEEFSARFKPLRSLLTESEEKYKERFKRKELPADNLIEHFFSVANLLPSSKELVEKAVDRFQRGNPPGKDNSYGDAIIWEALLENIPPGADLFFISDDKDFRSKIDPQSLSFVLESEWKEKKGSEAYYFRRLIDFLEKLPEIEKPEEIIEEENEILRDKIALFGAIAAAALRREVDAARIVRADYAMSRTEAIIAKAIQATFDTARIQADVDRAMQATYALPWIEVNKAKALETAHKDVFRENDLDTSEVESNVSPEGDKKTKEENSTDEEEH